MGSDLGGTPLFRERVLVVEDDKAIRALISTTLERQEVEPVLVSTGRAALAEAARSNPSVMLLDLGLPDMDGVEVIKAVRQWSMMFIIVVSARSEGDDHVNRFLGIGRRCGHSQQPQQTQRRTQTGQQFHRGSPYLSVIQHS